MTYKKIMGHIKFHRERIDELSDKLHNADNADVRKAIIDEMVWRAEEIGKLDTCNKKRLIAKLENFKKRMGF